MLTRTSRLAVALTVALGLLPAAARGQDYTPPDPQLPFPLFHDRPETGGLYFTGEFLFWRQTNPLNHQVIAIRGLLDFDGSITAAMNGVLVEPVNGGQAIIFPGQTRPGTFIGSGTPALFADDAGGPGTYQPGFEIGAGWRFRNGVAVDTSWKHLSEAKYAASATLVPPGLQAGANLSETFLFSPVFGFPNDYAGPGQKLAIGNPFAAYGIWNGASIMNIEFIQRFDQWDITGRIPVYQDDCSRCYGLIGSRLIWMWERFKWRTVSEDFTGNATPADVALYSNIVSQRMYGPHAGMGYERRLGDTPIGTFSVSVDLEAAPLLNVIKERAKYERSDHETAAQRARTEYTITPELTGKATVWWFPIEGVQLRLSYDSMSFFNTVAAPAPVSFRYGNLDPPWEKGHYRWIDGFSAGIALIF